MNEKQRKTWLFLLTVRHFQHRLQTVFWCFKNKIIRWWLKKDRFFLQFFFTSCLWLVFKSLMKFTLNSFWIKKTIFLTFLISLKSSNWFVQSNVICLFFWSETSCHPADQLINNTDNRSAVRLCRSEYLKLLFVQTSLFSCLLAFTVGFFCLLFFTAPRNWKCR